MATGYRDKADTRTRNMVRVIRNALLRADGKTALNEAVDALRSEAAHLRRRRPADGVITDAQLAGLLSGIAAVLHDYDPRRRDGGSGFPEPTYLVDEFAAMLGQAGVLPGEPGRG